MSSIRDDLIRIYGACISNELTFSYLATTLAGIPFEYTKHRTVWEGIIRFIDQLKNDQDQVVEQFSTFRQQLAPLTYTLPMVTKEMQKYVHLYGYYLITHSVEDIGKISLSGCHACAWSDAVKYQVYDDLLPTNTTDKCLCPLDFTIPIGLYSPSGKVYHCLGGLYDPIYTILIRPFTKLYNKTRMTSSSIQELTTPIGEADLIVSGNLAKEIYNLPVREGVISV